jgi:cytochrome P450
VTYPEARTYPFSAPDRLHLDPTYRQSQLERPLIRVRLPFGEEAWLATRYADVRLIMGDPRFSRAAAGEHDEPRTRPEPPGGGILNMDPPEHSRLRRLVAKAFTARRVELLRPRAQEIADSLIDDMVAAGPPADLVDRFALPLPVAVICELLGVPFADRQQFQGWSNAFLSTTSMTPQQMRESIDAFSTYMAQLIAVRRGEPREDLLSALIAARDEHDKLSEPELVEMCVGLLVAGHETTASQIPNMVYVLLNQPAALEQLRDKPELVPAAVEELMRWIPLGVAAAFARYAKEDVEVGGVLIRAGEPVLGALAAANRDPAVFTEPDAIDFNRADNVHIGFGHGVHHCLGAPLARMELQVALSTLVRRLPGLRLAVPEEELPWKTGMLVRAPLQLPVAW